MNCQSCGICIGGKYKIAKYTIGEGGFGDGEVIQERIEQKLYEVDGVKICGSCLRLLAERGYLTRFIMFSCPPTYEVIFRDGTKVKCPYQSLNKKIQEGLERL